MRRTRRIIWSEYCVRRCFVQRSSSSPASSRRQKQERRRCHDARFSPAKMARHFLVRRNYPVDGRNLSQKQILKRHTVARCAYRKSKRRRKISPALDLSMFALTRLSIAKSMFNRLTLGDDGRCVVCTELFDSAWFRSLLKQRQLFRMRLARRFQWLLLLVQPLFLEGPTTCHLRESDWP